MAKILVITEHETDAYDEAKTWVIDDRGLLHIVGDNGNLASYNFGRWISAEFVK